MIRILLPYHLRNLAQVEDEITLKVEGIVTLNSIINSLVAEYPMLQGTILNHLNQKRRPLLRFFVCGEDITHDSMDTPLPDAVLNSTEPLIVVGAIAGG